MSLLQPAAAQPEDYEAGVHYRELSQPLPDLDPERHEVVELFWYGCPVCYDLLPTMQIWESSYRSSDLNVFRLPVVWNQAMASHARVYFSAQELGLVPDIYQGRSAWEVTPTLHAAAFDAIQARDNPLLSAASAFSLFESAGVSRQDFDKAWHSDTVAARLDQVKAYPAMAEIPRLPALVLNGRYLISMNDAVTTSDDLFRVLNYLIYKVRSESKQ